MEQAYTKASDQILFRSFVLTEKNRFCLKILGLMLLQFIVFKLLYPFPDLFSDSYSYISAADSHLDVNIWPIGYSRFLAVFHWFTYSATALVAFQYLVFAFAGLYFYLTISYFYPTGTATRTLLSIFLFFNPLFLYLSNYVTSDMLFVSLSIIWLTQMIWVLNRPRLYQVILQAALLFIMFTFRYNAMVYPIIAIGVFLLSKQRAWVKALGIVSGPVLIIPFILWSSHAAKEMTGTAQFPPILGGWQWGNNALYIRPYIEEDSTAFPTAEMAELDRIARHYFAKASRPQDRLADHVGNYFIQVWDAPLKVYMGRHYKAKTEYEDIAAWGKSAVIFDQYGKFIVRRHPLAFVRYFMLMNSRNYFMPPLEKLQVYNMGESDMGSTGQKWFHYQNPDMWCISPTVQATVLAVFPFFFLLLNIYYAIGLFLFLRRGGFRKAPRTVQFTFGIITAFLALNAGFSIFANIIALRYQIFPMLVFLAFGMLQMDLVEVFTADAKKSAASKPQQRLSINA